MLQSILLLPRQAAAAVPRGLPQPTAAAAATEPRVHAGVWDERHGAMSITGLRTHTPTTKGVTESPETTNTIAVRMDAIGWVVLIVVEAVMLSFCGWRTAGRTPPATTTARDSAGEVGKYALGGESVTTATAVGSSWILVTIERSSC